MANGHVDPKARRDKRVIWVEFGVLLGGRSQQIRFGVGEAGNPKEKYTHSKHMGTLPLLW